MEPSIILYTLLTACAAGFTAWFWHLRTHEERTLRLGLAFLCSTVSILALLETLLILADVGPTIAMATAIAVAGAAVLIAFPAVLVVVLVASGIRLIRREGARPANLLSLGLGILLVVYVLVWPEVRSTLSSPPILGRVLDLFFGLGAIVVTVASVAFTCYTVTSIIVQVPHRKRSYQRIIVLGAGLLNGHEVSPLLAHRVDAGIAAWRQNPGSLLVMSGGQGADEDLPEACAMRDYAVAQGVPTEAIICEDMSMNTEENIANSAALILRDGSPAARALVVTDDYHVLRALLLARKQGFACDGRGSRVRLYFSLNALVREWVAYAVLRKQKYLRLLALLCGLYTVGWVALLVVSAITA